jgi:LacI family transcriptional regulator
MARTDRPSTLHDVARLAGVSYQTVSRVINGHPSVAESTRKSVVAAIEALQYHPNPMARGLATSRSTTLGVVSFGTRFYGPSQMLLHIEAAAKERGYAVMPVSIASLQAEEIRAALRQLKRYRVDAMLLIAPTRGAVVERAAELAGNTPLLVVDAASPGELSSVTIDQAAGAALATTHLISLGHTRVANISGPLSWNDAYLRYQAWAQTLLDHGLEVGPSLPGDWSAAGGYEAARALIQSGAEFSALQVGNDQMAIGALLALDQAGIRVPEDVSVVGFDDIPEAAYLQPPLTTVRQDFSLLGVRCVELLVEEIGRSELPPVAETIQPSLVLRQSAAPCAAPKSVHSQSGRIS